MPRRGRTVATPISSFAQLIATLLLAQQVVAWQLVAGAEPGGVMDQQLPTAPSMDPIGTENPGINPAPPSMRLAQHQQGTITTITDDNSNTDQLQRHSDDQAVIQQMNKMEAQPPLRNVDVEEQRITTAGSSIESDHAQFDQPQQSSPPGESSDNLPAAKVVEQHPPAAAGTTTTSADDHHHEHPHPKRNYASKECGAKVLYSNPESENRGAILNDPERDDYMRNPCERANAKFLIIELCETIQPTSLEIANFELFSSSPRNFRIWGSERYPTQEWTLIGEFEAQDSREVQPFQMLERASYSKFIKLELLTHYGKEHFCTLSTFRLYGTSMVDEYEAEAASALPQTSTQFPPIAAVDEPSVVPVQLENVVEQQQQHKDTLLTTSQEKNNNKDKDPLFEDYENNTEAPPECSLNGPGNVALNTSSSSSNSSTTDFNGNNETGGPSVPPQTSEPLIDEQQHVADQIANEIPETAAPSTEFIILSSPKANDQKQPKSDQKSQNSDRTPESNGNVNVLKTIVQIGSNIKEVLGQAFASSSGTKQKLAGGSHGNNRSAIAEWNRLSHRSLAIFCWSCLPQETVHMQRPQCNLLCYTFFIGKRQSGMKSPKKVKETREFSEFLKRVAPVRICPATTARKMPATQQQPQQRPTITAKQPSQQQQVVNKQQPQTISNQQQQQPQRPAPVGKVIEKGNLRPLPGTASTHKESVFMKLNKRLAALEQNMSVSSEHLLELTRRCASSSSNGANVKVAEELRQQQERIAKEAGRVAKQEAQRVEQDMKQKISELQREVRRLSQQLQSVQTTVQATGSGGYFYRPLLSPVHGYRASDGTEHACLTTLPPLHTTSMPYGPMPVANPQLFDSKPAADGLWTTSQVVYLMLLVQVGTVVVLKLFRTLFDRLHSCSPTTGKGCAPAIAPPAQLITP